MGNNPKAFISYSWDDNTHREWVKDLATKLRSDGIDVFLDQWHLVPGDQLTEFMEASVRDNDFVLIICTPQYKEKSNQRKGGVGYEGDIMTAEVFSSRNNRKFIPILCRGGWLESSPSWLSGKYGIDLGAASYANGYKELLCTLHNQRPAAPPLGPIPTKENKSEAKLETYKHLFMIGAAIGQRMALIPSSPSDTKNLDELIEALEKVGFRDEVLMASISKGRNLLWDDSIERDEIPQLIEDFFAAVLAIPDRIRQETSNEAFRWLRLGQWLYEVATFYTVRSDLQAEFDKSTIDQEISTGVTLLKHLIEEMKLSTIMQALAKSFISSVEQQRDTAEVFEKANQIGLLAWKML